MVIPNSSCTICEVYITFTCGHVNVVVGIGALKLYVLGCSACTVCQFHLLLGPSVKSIVARRSRSSQSMKQIAIRGVIVRRRSLHFNISMLRDAIHNIFTRSSRLADHLIALQAQATTKSAVATPQKKHSQMHPIFPTLVSSESNMRLATSGSPFGRRPNPASGSIWFSDGAGDNFWCASRKVNAFYDLRVAGIACSLLVNKVRTVQPSSENSDAEDLVSWPHVVGP